MNKEIQTVSPYQPSALLYFKQQQLMKYSEEHFTEKYKYYFYERYNGSVQILDSYKRIDKCFISPEDDTHRVFFK